MDTIKKERLTNTTIPRVYEALFNEGGDIALLRYLDSDEKTIQTFVARIPETEPGQEGTLRGEFLPRDIRDLSLSPVKNEVFYMLKTDDGVAGFVAPLKSPAQRIQIFSFPISEWIAQWTDGKTIILTSKASAFVPGYAYAIPSDGKTGMKKTLGGFPGLTTLFNANGSRALFSSSVQGGMALWTSDLKKNSSRSTIFGTLPEKCVWGKDGITIFCGIPASLNPASYPDDWYKGLVSFTDTVWKIDTETGASFALLDPGDLGSDFDIIKPFLSADERYLFFTNKKDMTLWMLDLLLI